MNKKDNLQDAFKKAFEEHQEPLLNHQWDKIDKELSGKRSKYRLFVWGTSVVLFFVAFAGGVYYVNNPEAILLEQETIQHDSENQTKSFNKHSKFGEIAQPLNVETDNQHLKHVAKEVEESNVTAKTGKQYIANEFGKTAYKQPVVLDEISVGDKKISELVETAVRNNNNDFAQDSESKDSILQFINPNTVTAAHAKDTLVDLVDNIQKNDTVAPVVTLAPNSTVDKQRKFAFGLSGGYSHIRVNNIKFENPNNMHFDTKKVFEKGVEKTSTFYFQLLFEYKIFKNIALSINTGTQYREITAEENIEYKLNYIPFRNSDGSISPGNYIFVPDTANPTVYRNRSVKTAKLLSVPLALNYVLPFQSKNELQFHAGIVFNKLLTAKGSMFSVNDFKAVAFKETMDKKVSIGYLAGLCYYRNIHKTFWLGAGYQLQNNKLKFHTNFGSINAKASINNLQINLKYKF